MRSIAQLKSVEGHPLLCADNTGSTPYIYLQCIIDGLWTKLRRCQEGNFSCNQHSVTYTSFITIGKKAGILRRE